MFVTSKLGRTMQEEINDLRAQIDELKTQFTSLLWIIKEVSAQESKALAEVDIAPYGYRKDGLPKKKPGRPAGVKDVPV